MAEATGLRNAALPYPVYGVPYGVAFPILDADGDSVTGAAALDSERSLNGDTFADCTNEATEIGTSGTYYLLLTAAEMTADVVVIQVKTTTSGAKTTFLTLYPRKLVAIQSGTVAGNLLGTTLLQLDSNAVAIADYYNGCLLVGTLDGTVEARIIADYADTRVCTVSPAFTIDPDNNDTYVVYLPEGKQIAQSDLVGWRGTAAAAPDTAGYPKVTIKDGTGTGEIDTTSGGVLVAAIAADAITAAAIAANAIGASELAADAAQEIADAHLATVVGAATVAAHTQFQTDTLAASPIVRADAVASATASTVVLDAGASGSDDAYNGFTIFISAGPGEGQAREIQDYVGATKTATPDGDWTVQPTSASKYIIYR